MIEALAAIASTLADLQSLAGSIAGPPDPTGGATAPAAPADGTASGTFSDALRGALGRLDDTIAAADGEAQSFASGNRDIPLSDVMVSLEQANLSLQMAANVRDKVVAAYSTVMNMQL